MIAIRMKKFYKKTGRRVRIDGNKPVGFDKKKLECFKCHNTSYFAKECPSKGTNNRMKRDSFYQDQGARKKEQNQNCLLTMDDGVVYWGEHIVEEEETNHALMAISLNTEINSFKGVPHPLTGDYTPKPQEEIDDSLYVYGKKGPQKPKISDSDDNSTEHSTCPSNDSEGSFGNPSEHSSESESESISVPNEMTTSKSVTTNEKVVSESKEVEPSCAKHVKTPRQQMKNQGTSEFKGKKWNKMMERELGEGYSFIKKKCFVCGSLSHLIKDCDYYEKKMAREAEFKKQRVFNTGNRVAKPVWNNAHRVNHANHFVPRPVQLNVVRQNVNSVRPNVNTGRVNVNSVRTNVNTGRSKQPVPTCNSNSFSPVRPQVNKFNQRSHFSKSHSPVRRPIAINTSKMCYFNVVKGNWGTAVKTSAGYNWRNSRPNSNCDSGPTFIRTVNAKGSSTQEHGGQRRDSYEKKLIRVEKIHTDFNVADLLTKAFDGPRFKSGRLILILVGFLKKPEGSAGFEQIVDFLKGTHIRYALEHNPTIYVSVIKQFWQTVTVITLDNGEQELKATIDTHEYTISESSVRNKLKLADENGITELTNAEIFEGMANLGYPIDNTFTFWKKHFTPNWKFMVHHILHCISSKSGGWDQFGSKLATALICLSTGRTYNFSKMIFEAMVANPVESQPPPNASVPSTSQPTTEPHPDQEIETKTELHGSSSDFVHTPPTQVETSSPELKSISPEPMEHTFDQPSTDHQPLSPRQAPEAPKSQYPSHPHVPEARSLTAEDLLHMVPTLITKVDSLETELKQTKQTMGKAIVKLVKKVKKLENILKRRNVVLTTSEDDEPEDQGRIFKDIDDDPLVSFVTPTKPSGEAQEEISPTTLEAAKTLLKVASQSTGFEEVNIGGLGFSTGSRPVSSDRGQREGKAQMIIEETQAPKRTKEQIQQEEASLAEAMRLQNLEEEETAKQVHLDALLAKRLAEEEELTKQQKQRKAQVQFKAQHYTEEDWDAIRAKLEANAELAKSVIAKDMSEEDFAKRMVDDSSDSIHIK
ncbi:hypothetical protein Tco_0040838 [Tanacetum coccineum]